ncbi:MAG: hypothetical protein AB8F95_01555 [Bacteroidia bacterium]
MKRLYISLSVFALLIALASFSFAQTIQVGTLDPQYSNSSYSYLKFGTAGGWMHNLTHASYGNGDDMTLFTYNSRDLVLRAGNGNIVLHPTSSNGNVGLFTSSPTYDLEVNRAGTQVIRFGSGGSSFTMDIAGGLGLVNMAAGGYAFQDSTGRRYYKYLGTRGYSRIGLHDGEIKLYVGDKKNAQAIADETVNQEVALSIRGIGLNKIGFFKESPVFKYDFFGVGNELARFGDHNGNDLAFDVAGGNGLANISAGGYARLDGNGNTNFRYSGTRGFSRIGFADGEMSLYVGSKSVGTKGSSISMVEAINLVGQGENRIGLFTGTPQARFDMNGAGRDLFRLGTTNGNSLSVDIAGGSGLVNLVAGGHLLDGGREYGYLGTRGASRILMADGGLTFMTANKTRPDGDSLIVWNDKSLVINHKGRVSINTNRLPADTTYFLVVDGKMLVEEVRVQVSENWPDYVFNKDYELRPLSEVETYIEENGHLPEVPSAAEVAEDGVVLGANDAVLLKKIEELTLYLLQQQKEIEALKKALEDQK